MPKILTVDDDSAIKVGEADAWYLRSYQGTLAPALPPTVGQDPEPQRIFYWLGALMLLLSSCLMSTGGLSMRLVRVSCTPHAHSKVLFRERQSSSRPRRISLSPHTHSRTMRSEQKTKLSDNGLGKCRTSIPSSLDR